MIQPVSSGLTTLDWLVGRYACKCKIQLDMDHGSALLLLFTVKREGAKVACACVCFSFIIGKPIYQAQIIFIKYWILYTIYSIYIHTQLSLFVHVVQTFLSRCLCPKMTDLKESPYFLCHFYSFLNQTFVHFAFNLYSTVKRKTGSVGTDNVEMTRSMSPVWFKLGTLWFMFYVLLLSYHGPQNKHIFERLLIRRDESSVLSIMIF